MRIGDKVTWTHTSQRGRSISMRRMDGVIVAIEGGTATVRTNKGTGKPRQVPGDGE